MHDMILHFCTQNKLTYDYIFIHKKILLMTINMITLYDKIENSK